MGLSKLYFSSKLILVKYVHSNIKQYFIIDIPK